MPDTIASTLQVSFLLIPTTTLYTKYYCYPYFTDKEPRPREVKGLSQGPAANRQVMCSRHPTWSPYAGSCWATLHSVPGTWHCPAPGTPTSTRVNRHFKLLLVRNFIYGVDFLHSKALWINCEDTELGSLFFPTLGDLHEFPEPDTGHLDFNPIPSPSAVCAAV